MTKFKQYYKEMFEQNRDLFESFKPIHDQYFQDKKKWGPQFHQQGKPVVEVMKEWEKRLCTQMERGNFAKYSNHLSDKFWEQVKKEFPYIELVGVRSSLE